MATAKTKRPASKKTTKKAVKKSVKKPSVKKTAVKKSVKKQSVRKPAVKSQKALYSFKENMKLFKRGAKVIPGGIYGHQTPALMVPGEYPYYSTSSKGCRYWDIDGNEFIDYMCGYGPMVVGYQNPQIEKAVDQQRKKVACSNHPAPLQVELAERMVKLVPFADWAVFAKNGSDITTWATLVARDHTRRKKILAVKGEYHGAHAWCSPGHNGIIDEDREHIHLFEWNDLEGLRQLARKYDGEVAGIIMTPYHHPAFGDSVLPAPGFWAGVRQVCDENGIVLILDDVRAGFRLDVRGSQEYFGFEPDISCYCKAIANGYSISAGVGRKELRISASKVFLTGSYWNSAMEMAAAMETLSVLESTDAVGQMMKMGKMLNKGLTELSQKYGFQLSITGPPTIPYVRFTNETDFYRMQMWATEVTRRGSFFHPHHNWFLSSAHTQKEINESLNHSEDAFKVLKTKFDS